MEIVKTIVFFGSIALAIELLILLYNYLSKRTGNRTTDIDSGTVLLLLFVAFIAFVFIGELYKSLTQ
ncbi:hypothetical protein KDA00_01805 [Candidatus Saccharibacteria bacterium]|nr:hypothetical protein [Candidatus Saccharibacteria bacterium]